MEITGWIEIGAFLIVGLISLWGIFDGRKKDLHREKDDMEVGVINLLKEQIAVLDRKVSEQSHIIADLQERILKISSENRVMRDILQEKDKETVSYRRAAIEAMKKGDETFKRLNKIEKNIEDLLKIIDKKIDISLKKST